MNIEHLPAVIAIPWRHFTHETNPRLKLWAACEVYEVLVRFGVMLQLAELRALPDADDRLAAAVARIRDHIGSPTLGKWLGMMSELAGQLRRTDPLVLPELPTLTNALAALAPKDAPREWDASLLVLRNALAHGGGVTAPIAERLLADWEPLLRGAMESLACLAGTTVVWFEAGYARPITPDGGLAEALTNSADLRTTLTAAGLDRRVLLLKGDRALNLWPLCDYAPATMTGWGRRHTTPGPVPQVYLRAETTRLLYAALGCDVPVHTSDGHAAFREFFGLNRKSEPHQQSAHDFAADLRAETAAVRGRKKELQELKDWVKAATDRVLWVFGPGGIGKSYLVAKLAHDLSNGDQFAVVFWRFRAGDANRCNRNAFFRHAICTLGDTKHHFVTSRAQPHLDETQLLKQFLDLLKVAGTSSAHRPLFVLDGMDEIARSDPDFVRSIFDWRSGSAVWVCAGRHEGDVVPGVFAADKCRHVWANGLPGLSEGEVRQMIDARIGSAHFTRLLANDTDGDGGTYNRLTDAISRRAAGLPLYVHFVCEDILAGQLPLDGTLPTKLPDSLAKYFDDLLRRRGIGDVDALKTPLVVFIAWALAPLDTDTLRELLQRRRSLPKDRAKADDLLARGLEAVQSMLRPVAVDGGQVGYEPYHLTFRDHIRADDGVSTESETARDLYCECASDWSRFAANTSPRQYLLRHGSEHLLREKRWAELEALARDVAFLMAQRNELPTDPAAVVRSLQHTLTGAGEQDSGTKLADAVLRLAERYKTIYRSSPLTLLRAGNLDGALKLADLQQPQRRMLWHLLLVYQLYLANDTEGISIILNRLGQPAEAVLEDWQGTLAVDIISPLARSVLPHLLEVFLATLPGAAKKYLIKVMSNEKIQSGCMRQPSQPWQSLLEIALTIHSCVHRAGALQEIAAAQATAGDTARAANTFRLALETAGRIEDDFSRARAFASIAAAQSRAMDFVEAFATSGRIEVASVRAGALREVAAAQATAGELDAAANTFRLALETVGRINDDSERAESFRAIASAQATAGDNYGAAETAGRIEDDWSRAVAFVSIASAQATAGDSDAAAITFRQGLQTINRIDPDSDLAKALRAIAAAQASDDTFRDALKSTCRIAIETDAEDSLRSTAVVHATAGDIVGALATAGRIEDDSVRAGALREIAAVRATTGDTAGAADTFRQALETANRIAYVSVRAGTVREIASAQAAAGDTDGATESTSRIEGVSYRVEALRAIAAAQATAGDTARAADTFSLALERTSQIEDDSVRAWALREIALTQAASGDTVGAANTFHHTVKWASRISGDLSRTQALIEITAAQATAGDTAAAAETAGRIVDDFHRTRAFLSIALGQASAQTLSGDHAAAADTFRQELERASCIEKDSVRTGTLREIAAAQAMAGDTVGAADTFRQALTTAGRIEENWVRGGMLLTISAAQAAARDIVGAVETFRQTLATAGTILDEPLRSKALQSIAAALATAGDIAGALETAGRIDLNVYRMMAFVSIAAAQATAKDSPGADVTFNRAEEVTQTLSFEADRSLTRFGIAQALVLRNFFDEARQMIRLIIDIIAARHTQSVSHTAEQISVLEFKLYLQDAGRDIRTAIHACGQLARLYPADATAIAELLIARQPAATGESA